MALKIRRSVHENTKPEIICFESDEEFEDWAVAPYATIVETETGKRSRQIYCQPNVECVRVQQVPVAYQEIIAPEVMRRGSRK